MARVGYLFLPTIASLLATNTALEELQFVLRDRTIEDSFAATKFDEGLVSLHAPKLRNITLAVSDGIECDTLKAWLPGSAVKYTLEVVKWREGTGE